jgi:aspartate/methionine/tyrosine aminotransferase
VKSFEVRNRHFDRLFNTSGLMWLGQNTNHFPTHPAVRQAMLASIDAEEYHAYAPPAGMQELRELILADLGLTDASVLVTDGAVEALYIACRACSQEGATFVTTDPGWKWPMQFAQASGARVVEIPIYGAEHHWRLSAERLADAVDERTRVVYLVDPNNPLGVCYTPAEIEAFTSIARRVGAYFVHDCTYRDFADQHTLAARFYPERTITIYSFSKWLGLAGLRVGALVAPADVIERIAAAPPNNLGSNVVSQRAAIAGLKVKREWMPEVNRRQRRNQAEIRKAVDKVQGLGIATYPSQANFLVIETVGAGVAPEALCAAFQMDGIMIRQGTYHTPRFGHRFVKVATTVPEPWADAFCGKLPQMVERAREIKEVPQLF